MKSQKDALDFMKKYKGEIALTIATILSISGFNLYSRFSKKNEMRVVFRNLNNEKSGICSIYDGSGKKLDDISNVEYVVTFGEKLDEDFEQSIIVTEDESMRLGYIDKNDIEDNKLFEYKTDLSVKEFNNIYRVSSEHGCFLRKNKIVDQNTDDAIFLENGRYLIASNIVETSSDNAYSWVKVLYVDDDGNIYDGYVASEYLINVDLNEFKGNKFKVCTADDVTLKLRKDHDSKSELISEIKSGEIVYLIPNVFASYSDGRFNWFYVAHETDDGLEFGWCASEYTRTDGSVLKYLELVKNELTEIEESSDISNNEDSIIIMEVNTSKDGGVPLKLRETPGIDNINNKILARLDNGSTLFIKASDLNKIEKVDGYEWVFATTDSGEKGYVAKEYLDEYKTESINSNFIKQIASLDSEGNIEGYIGIDVAPNLSSSLGSFEEILKGNVSFPDTRGISIPSRPNFVMIRVGASAYGNSQNLQILNPRDNSQAALDYANLCEKYKIPYGFYYFSSSISKEEANQEIDYIVNCLSSIKNNKYFILPVVDDVEIFDYNIGSRCLSYIRSGNRQERIREFTDLHNYIVKEIEDRLGVASGIYSSCDIIGTFESEKKLLDNNKLNCKLWLVDIDKNRSQQCSAVSDSIFMRQIRCDYATSSGAGCDINFINAEYFEDCLKKNNLDNTTQNRDLNYSFYNEISDNVDLSNNNVKVYRLSPNKN